MTPLTSVRVNNDLAPEVLVELARRADVGGLDQLWLSHDIGFESASVLVGLLAAHTERIRLGIGIANPYSQHPVELAMLAATSHRVSGGRFALGIGAGAEGFLRSVGIDRVRPLATTRAGVVAVRALLAGRSPAQVGLDGWSPGALLVKPEPEVPLYLGATGPRMRALAGELCDGVLALMLPPECHATVRAEVEAGFTEPRPSFDLPVCLWLSMSSDADAARVALAPKLALYGPELGPHVLTAAGLRASDFDPVRQALTDGGPTAAAAALTPEMVRLAVVGTPAEVVDRCRSLVAGGAQHLSFGPPLGPDPVEAVDQLVGTVVPALAH